MKDVSAGIIVRNGKIFIAQRPEGKPLPNVWEFPGGKLEPGETLPQCLKRELKEELDVDAEIGEFIMNTPTAMPAANSASTFTACIFPTMPSRS